MTQTTREPAEVFHPVEYLRDELEARGWTLDTLATRILGDDPRVNPACAKQWGVERLSWDLYFAVAGTETGDHCSMGERGAAALERVLGISAGFWMRSEALWKATPAERRSPPPDPEEWLSGFDSNVEPNS